MATAARARVRYRIGEHELEIEGPTAFVDRQVERWVRLTGLAPAPDPAPHDAADPARQPVFPASPTPAPTLADLFRFDPARKLVVPRIVSPGRRRNTAAALLTLYGYRLLLPQTPVVSSALFRTALASAGCRISRLDRILQRHIEAGLVTKSGTRKREFFALTVSGEQRAITLARELCVPNPSPQDTNPPPTP